MSGRFEESQWPEMQERIERLERWNWRLQHEVVDLKRSDDTVKEIRIAGRNTQGVRIFNLSGEEKVVSAIKIDDNFN